MTPAYPQFYLDGNIDLQKVVDDFREWTRRTVWKWLAFTCVSFTFLLLGVTFEIPVLTLLGVVELLICANTLHILLTPRADHL